jgi:hypothetical protein
LCELPSTLSRVTPERKKRKRDFRQKTPFAFLRSLISKYDWGYVWDGHPIHANKERRILNIFDKVEGCFPFRLSNQRLSDHLTGHVPAYFTMNAKSNDDLAMFMVDVDCHKSGDKAEALRFVQSLDDLDVYPEPSKRGAHGYVLLHKGGHHPEFVNGLLDRLAECLDYKAHTEGYDIEHVEVKGQALVYDFQTKNLKVGKLAAIPVDLLGGFAQWQQTVKPITVTELHRLVTKLEKQRPKVKVVKHEGSLGCPFTDADLESTRFGGKLYKIARELMSYHPLRTSSRTVVEFEDMAVHLMELRWFTKNMNKDGSMPSARFEYWSNRLKAEGKIKRGHDCHRHAAMNRLLSSLGLLDWQDNTYVPPTYVDGHKVEGRAAQWQATEAFMQRLEQDNDIHTGQRESLAVTEWVKSLVQCPESEVIRPVAIEETPLYRLNADEISPYIRDLQQQLAI